MNRTEEVATDAPAKSRRARTKRRREWTAGLVALASALGVALVPALGATPAGATGPTLTTLTGHGGATAPALGVPVAEGSAQVNPVYVAYNPSNGDEAIASTKAGAVFVYLIAGSSEANEYNIETNNSPVTNGSLVAGDVYVMAGTGTAGLIAQPGNNQFGNSPSAVATTNPIEPTSVAFDPNGNVLIAGENTSSGNSAIQVVAQTTGTFYGVSMTAGDLYTIADVGLSGSPSTAINMGNVAAQGNGMSVDASGNIAVGDGDGVEFVNEQSSGSLSLYGLSIAHQSAAVVSGNNQGGTDCAPGATSDPANSLFFQSAAPTFDSSDNLYFSDNEIGGVNGGGCAWVEPAHSGTLDGLSVTAGNVYKLAGNGGTTATADGTAGVQSNVSGTSEMTLDGAGNVVLAVESGTSFGTSPAIQVLAESTGTYYGTAMNAGDLYTVAGGPSNKLATLNGPTSVLNAGGGNLLFTDGAATSANLDELSGAPTGAAAPTVTAVSPSSGPTSGGTSVTITGTNFTGATAVHFGANAATGVLVNSATSISATSPAGTGTVDVTVTTPGGTSSANPPNDNYTYNAPSGGAITLTKTTALVGNYNEKVGGTGWNADTSVTINQCASTSYSAATCDAANKVTATLGTGTHAGIFTNAVIHLATGAMDTNGDTCGLAGSPSCYVVVVGNTGDSTASAALGFTLPSVTLKKTAAVLGNYLDGVKALGFPIGDTVVAQECDASVSIPSTVSSHCDTATQITGTVAASGAVVFSPTGVTLRVDSAYTDTAAGTCPTGGTCDIVVTDSNNAAFAFSPAVAFATPVVTLHKTTAVLGNYLDAVKTTGFPIGDTVVAQECDASVSVPSTVSSHCDGATQITGTVGSTGVVLFSPTGVTLRVGSAYTETAAGTCETGGTCDIVVTDSNNAPIEFSPTVAFATSAVTVKKTTAVLGNYVDPVKATAFPIGDTVVAQECDASVSVPSTVSSNCDPSTQITGTVGTTGVVTFSPTGVTLKDGSSYSDGAAGTCPAGGTCEIVFTDSSNAAIGFEVAVTFAAPVASVHLATNVPANYVDHVIATSFPIGDTVTAQECESNVTASNMGTHCDNATQITGTVGSTGVVTFSSTGVTILIGSYSDTNGGTLSPGGTADVVVNDSTEGGFYVAIPVTLHP